MAVAGTLTGTFQANDVRQIGIGSGGSNIPINYSPSTAFSTGTGALGVQVLFQQVRTFSGTTDNLDLFAGLDDSYGTPVVLTAVKGLLIVNTGADPITVGNAGSNPWDTLLSATGTITLPPGAWFVCATPDAVGWVVGTSTNVNLLVTGTSGQTYNVAFLGTGT
jgi:hypothetical protein